jgi:hypothetical protein
MPGAEERVRWKLIPVECGYVKVPGIKVVDRRKAITGTQGIGDVEGETEEAGSVVLVDVRWERREREGDRQGSHTDPADSQGRNGDCMGSVLVLP